MKYIMNVTIYNPEAEENMCSDIFFKLECEFAKEKGSYYGNGYHVSIKGKGVPFDRLVYDLRYDTDFHAKRKEVWLTNWAHAYWSGQDGAYAVKELTIRKEA